MKEIELQISTPARHALVDVTAEAQRLCSENGWREGVLFLYIPHTTCGITINENADPDVKTDMIDFLRKLVPYNPNFLHSEGNSDSHILASLTGFSQTVFVTDGKLSLGLWQAIYLAEYDGPRRRKIWAKFQAD